MGNSKNEKDTIKKVYGDENLKEILTDLLEKTFMKEIDKVQNSKK